MSGFDVTTLENSLYGWTEMLHVVIPGRPVGAARPRVMRLPSGRSHTFMPDKTVAWEERARQILANAWDQIAAREVACLDVGGGGPSLAWPDPADAQVGRFREPAPPFRGLVAVEVVVVHHRPRRLCRRADPRERVPAASKPDIDNVLKLAMDAIVKAGVIPDDTRVCEVSARRLWCAIDPAGQPVEPEGVEIRVLDVGVAA